MRTLGKRSLAVRGLTVLGALALAWMVGATPADAKHKRHKHSKYHKHDKSACSRYWDRSDSHHGRRHAHGYGHRYSHGHARFVVPHRIHAHDRHYAPYYWGRTYHRSHRHYHAVYSFPVYSHAGVVYEPHAYCGDALYATGRIEIFGPRFGFYFGF